MSNRFNLEEASRAFNSRRRVLFNLLTWYLFAVGLVVIFSLRWSLPPASGCTLKQPYSRERLASEHAVTAFTGLSPSMASKARITRHLGWPARHSKPLPYAASHDQCSTKRGTPDRATRWTILFSVALTERIPVGFFSSAH